jgi:hypothetical protein
MIVMERLPGNGYSALPWICTLSKQWLTMDVCSTSDIPAFKQYATIYIYVLGAVELQNEEHQIILYYQIGPSI